MAQIGVDEACSLTTFYHDQLLRLAAYNYQCWTAGSEREAFDDQGEYNDVTGYTPYPWEQMGLFNPGDPLRMNSPIKWQIQHPEESKVEPLTFWQMPWHRTRHVQGYLGQGGQQLVQCPPTAGSRAEYANGEPPPQYPGVCSSHVGLDGRYTVQSAKGISLAKRAAIVMPTRTHRAEQPASGAAVGDDDTNYMAAGHQGGGPAPKITGDIRTKGPHPGLNRAAGLFDLHAYLFNYSGVHPFVYHEHDYDTPEELDLTHTGNESVAVPDFSELEGAQFLSPEGFEKSWRVDHRFGTQKFSLLAAGLDLLQDGGVVLYGGCGEEIRMAGGSIFLSAPGDVWLQAGRNVVQWAGRDIAIRAKNSMDLTATEADVRIKAERNLQVLGGNSHSGGVLIESLASSAIYDFDEPGEKAKTSGVMLRAAKAQVVAWAGDVYLRTGGGSGDDAVREGEIILDADRGKRDIFSNARNHVGYVRDSVSFNFGDGQGLIDKTTYFGKDSSVIATQLEVNGSTIIGGSLITKGSIAIATGHIGSSQGGIVDKFTGDDLTKVRDAANDPKTSAEQTLPIAFIADFENLQALCYDEGQPGNDAVISKATVSLRVVVDYRTQDFALYESRWQQMARLAGRETKVWRGKPVLWQGVKTEPYPGKDRFEEDKSLRVQDRTIFNLSAKTPKPHGPPDSLAAAYASPEYAEPTEVSLQGYTVV